MTRRCLYRPSVVFSEQPDMVVTKTPLDSPDTFYETVLTPIEARRYALDLLNDADRAERVQATNEWLRSRRAP